MLNEFLAHQLAWQTTRVVAFLHKSTSLASFDLGLSLLSICRTQTHVHSLWVE